MTKYLCAFLVGLALVGGFAAPAFAQINTVPQVGLTTDYLRKTTYTAVWIGLVPAASATDLVCIAGSSTRTIRLQRISFSGTAGTAINVPVTLLRRTTLNTGGTAASTTANPANTIGKTLTGDPTPTATLISYTANPTINDTSPTYLASDMVGLPLAASGSSGTLTFDFGFLNENLLREPTIAAGATTQQICANLNATSVSSGVVTGYIQWTEE